MGRGPLEWRRRTFRQSAASLLDRGTVPLEKFQMNTQSDEPGTHKDRSGVTRHAGVCDRKLQGSFGGVILLSVRLTLSLPRMINFKFPLQLHQQYCITQFNEELGFS